MKTFTQRKIRDGQIVQADDINDEAAPIYGEINGTLGQENMPVASITNTDFALPERTAGLSYGVTSAEFPTQTFYQTRNSANGLTTGTYGGVAYSLQAPAIEWDWGDNPEGGWFYPPQSIDGTRMDFDAKEGMVKGAWTCSIQRGGGFADNKSTTPVDNEWIGRDWSLELGIFLNGNLIARTGERGAGHHTYHLPFHFPVGNSPCEIRTAIRIETDRDVLQWTYALGLKDFEFPPVRLFSTGLWVRNVYR